MVVVYDGVFTKDLEEKYQSHFQCISHELSDFQKFSIKSIIDGDEIGYIGQYAWAVMISINSK